MIPLRFEVDYSLFRPELLTKFTGTRDPGGKRTFTPGLFVVFAVTPEGMVVTAENVPGFWLIPRSDVERTLAESSQRRREEISRRAADAQQRRAAILLKYDRNKNSVLDPDERVTALSDPEFLETELDSIDANHDGWLEATELSYFDIKGDHKLGAREEAGINLAQQLLAARLLAGADTNKDGLDSHELRAALPEMPGLPANPGAHQNPASRFDLPTLTALLKEATLQDVGRACRKCLAQNRRAYAAYVENRTERGESLKSYLGFLWANTSSNNPTSGGSLAKPLLPSRP